jgi:hypothetical protein
MLRLKEIPNCSAILQTDSGDRPVRLTNSSSDAADAAISSKRRCSLKDHLPIISISPSAPACGVLQDDPDDEDQSYNNPNLNFLLAGPFPTFHFDFAFSPSSTSWRMASGRDRSGSFCLAIHASKVASGSSSRRTPISVPLPVVTGRPRFFFWITLIDFAIIYGYHKSKPRGSANFRPGSNPETNGDDRPG